jgi:DNA-binding beta-propeller fold protein YncE
MKRRLPAILLALTAATAMPPGLALAAKLAPPAKPAKPAKPAPPAPPAPLLRPYAIANTFNIGGEGGWDSITVDPEGKLLFIPRVHRVQVVDAANGKVISEIGPGLGMCSVAVVPASNRGFISQSKDNSVVVFDLKTYAILGKIPVGDDPGNLIYDEASKKILLCSGGTKSLVCFSPDIDLKTPKLDPPVDLVEKPDSLVADGNGMVYVTLHDKEQVAVVDTRIMKLATTWPVAAWQRPTGISMDRLHSRLFLGCRNRVIIMSATDGHIFEAGDITLGTGVDGTAFHDGHVFATSTDGTLFVLGQQPEGRFVVQQKLGTSLMVHNVTVNPKTGVLYLPAAEMNRHKIAPDTFRIITLDQK